MFPVHYKYEVNCPRCNTEINHNGIDDKIEYSYHGEYVVEERCPICSQNILVKLNKYAIGKIDYEHALPIIKKNFGYYLEINQQVYERLKEQGIFVERKKDLVVSDYKREELNVVMH